MPPQTYQRLRFSEREEISRGLAVGESIRDIGKRIIRSASCISREVNSAGMCILTYRAERGQKRADAQLHTSRRVGTLAEESPLRVYVYEKLRIDWSPQEIAARLKKEYPLDMTMRISHETIYTHLYCLPKGELKKELMRHLRQERTLRKVRKNSHDKRGEIPDMVSIEERPDSATDRAIPGHWEGDLILGAAHASALGTLVERTGRYPVISHEGGHRRISRVTEIIPDEVWGQPGFSFMMNAIEDPRDNNFVAENYPRFKEWMDMAYEMDLAEQTKARAEANDSLGFQPRFMQAGFEYIRQWFNEVQGREFELTSDLPNDVREVVEKTLPAAKDSWWLYPSRIEADASEETITRYAEGSYKINLNRIWPEFKKLVENDQEDQKMQEFLQDQKGQRGGGEGDFSEGLTEDEKQELKDFLEGKESSEGGDGQEKDGSKGRPIPLDQMSKGLKQKIREFIDSLPEDVKEELQQRAGRSLKEFQDKINETLEGKLKETEEQENIDERKDGTDQLTIDISPESENLHRDREASERKAQEEYRKLLQDILEKDLGVYEKYREQILPIIDRLEQDLREIFVGRKSHPWQTGFRLGKRIDLKHRIQEKVKGVLAIQSKAWQRRELPMEKDYAITLLVDLSGSMTRGGKIQETFKAVVVLTEVLNKLSISLEVLGFNQDIYEYQKYGENLTQEMREKMGAMLEVVHSDAASYNDDGWALQEASKRLAKQAASEKFIIALSDGQPAESSAHPGSQYPLDKIIEGISRDTDQSVIGLGIGKGTEHVSHYYPISLANVELKEMADQLADLIKRVIEESGRTGVQ